jgi:hypothetical protein
VFLRHILKRIVSEFLKSLMPLTRKLIESDPILRGELDFEASTAQLALDLLSAVAELLDGSFDCLFLDFPVFFRLVADFVILSALNASRSCFHPREVCLRFFAIGTLKSFRQPQRRLSHV